jgi:quercetin dioxygenase-like cupin family protein
MTVSSIRVCRPVQLGLLAVCASLFATPSSDAQDPAVVNPKTIKVKLDNDRVRVLEAVLRPGDKEALHSHPASVYYVIDGGKMRNHKADGTVAEVDLVPGQTVYRDPVTHWAENIGTTTVRIVLVELKEEGKAEPR